VTGSMAEMGKLTWKGVVTTIVRGGERNGPLWDSVGWLLQYRKVSVIFFEELKRCRRISLLHALKSRFRFGKS
jgi:hypothetical protein